MQLAFNTTDSFMVSANVCDYTRQLSLRIQGRKGKVDTAQAISECGEKPSLLLLACLVDQRLVNVGNDTSTSNGSLQAGMKRFAL